MKTQQRGFIALISALIISAVLTAIVVAGNLTSILSRLNVFDAEAKERSTALADACVDMIRYRLSYDATYAGPETFPVGADTCQVLGATNPVGNPRVYKIQAVFQQAYTNLQVSIDVNDFTITDWQEVPTY